MARRTTTKTKRKPRKKKSAPPTRGWWGDGDPPWERWPGVSLEIKAKWNAKLEHWESDCGRYYFDELAASKPLLSVSYFEPTRGALAGKPMEYLPWQEQLVVLPLFGWLRKSDGLRRFRYVFVEVAKKNGKALSLDTEIPTPGGWTTMGEVSVGDEVYGPDGKPTRVVAATDVMHGRDCYDVEFSDGTGVTADADHLWQTRTRKPKRSAPEVRTTRQIAESLRVEYSGSAGWNHSIRMHSALEAPPADLPIAPYVMGAWLGDGSSDSPMITLGDVDLVIADIIRRDGYSMEERKSSNESSTLYRLGGELGYGVMKSRLRAVNVLGNKHIPAIYLRASISQRLELLRGLMDTDGYAAVNGQCEFTTMTPALWVGVLELLRSLGFKPTSMVCDATIGGRVVGTSFRVQFWCFSDEASCFHLPRKTARLKPRPQRHPRSLTRHIVSCEPTHSVPVRCIQVDRPDGLFLCGRGMVTTHNSLFCSGLAAHLAFCDGERGAEAYVAAGDEKQANIVWGDTAEMIDESEDFKSEAGVEVLASSVVQESTGSSFQALTAKAATKHGFDVHALIFDELHVQKARTLFETLKRGVSARAQPVILVITTAGDNRESICYEEHEKALRVLAGEEQADHVLPVVFRLEEGDDWRDEAVWHKVNPGLGVVKSLEYMRTDCQEAQNEPRKRNDFLRLELNVWTESRSVWIPPESWAACQRADREPADLVKLPCVLGLDLSETLDLTALVAAFRRPDERPEDEIEVEGDSQDAEARVLSVDFSVDLRAWFWIPESTVRDRAKGGYVPYDQWAREGWLTIVPGDMIDQELIRRTILTECMEPYEVRELGFDPYNCRQLAARMLSQDGVPCVEVRQGALTLSAPCKLLEGLVRSRRITHDGNSVLSWCFANAEVHTDANGNIRPVKPGGEARGTRRIDGVLATVMALARMMVLPAASDGPTISFMDY